jgi:membrane-associated phospholipid phosphatase
MLRHIVTKRLVSYKYRQRLPDSLWGERGTCNRDRYAPGANPSRDLAGMATAESQHMWATISLFGSPYAMTGLCLVLVVALALRRQWRVAMAVLLVDGLGGLLNVTLKAAVRRPRPPGSDLILHDHSWSFPSGHAMGSLIGYGVLCYLAVHYWPIRRTGKALVIASSTLIVAAVGVSRVALGVHYPGDVTGGWVIGAVWLVAGIVVLRHIEAGTSRVEPAGAGVSRP